MTYFQPRIPYKFTNAAASAEFVFPLAEFSFEMEQELHAPDASLTGAHGTYDLLVDDVAPRGPGRVRISFTVYEDDPETVEETVDEMITKIYSYGRGWLYSKGLVSGSEVLRRTRARALAMPALSWEGGMVLSKKGSIAFRTDPFWQSPDALSTLVPPVAATGTITVPVQPTIGDTFTIGSKVFTFVAEVDANANGEVGIGANVAAAQANIRAAINGSDGFNTAHTQVTCAAFSANAAVVTATSAGQWGMGIAFSETFTSASNVMNGGGFLGGTTAGTGTPYSGTLGTFTITNPGSAPVLDAVITLAGCTYANPTITNTTNTYRLKQTRTGTETLVFDAGNNTVTRAGVNDYANFDRLAGQVGLMRLEPGVNSFTVSGITAGTIAADPYPAYY